MQSRGKPAPGSDFSVWLGSQSADGVATSELQTNTGTHHCMIGEVYVWIVIELPEPMRTIIVNSQTDSANELAGIGMSRLENAIEGNAIVSVQLVPPNNVSVLLLGVQTHIKDRISLNAIVVADFVSYSKLDGLTRIPKEIEKSLQVCS